MKPGWFKPISGSRAGDAHYFEHPKFVMTSICGRYSKGDVKNPPILVPWELPLDLGRVHLCEECKRVLNPTKREPLIVHAPTALGLVLSQVAKEKKLSRLDDDPISTDEDFAGAIEATTNVRRKRKR